MSEEASPPGGGRVRISAALAAARRRLPPVRLLWLALVVLAVYGLWFLGGLGLASVLVLPIVAVLTDLLFQRVRFETFRFPDAALATGLFLALLYPPVVSLVAAGASVFLAVTVRHALRIRGRPWLNPTALGLVAAALLFGVAPAWWAAISEPLVVALGAAVVLWQRSVWRVTVGFLLLYAVLATVLRVVGDLSSGVLLVPRVLLLTAVDPTVVFFGLFMVGEPRSAPSAPLPQAIYAIVIATSAAMLPLGLPSLALPFALLAGNLVAVGMRWRGIAGVATGTSERARTRRAPESKSVRWSVGRRVGAGLGVFVLVGMIALVSYSPATSPANVLATHPITGGGGPVAVSQCQQDNSSIPASTLQSLHKTLGPSVILAYTPSTNLVVFYDPVNSVTVTETDLYEDFGYAEFNGDDFTSVGCVPP